MSEPRGQPALDAAELASRAEAATGLSDFGDSGFRRRLDLMVEHMRRHPDLQTHERRRGAAEDLVDIAASRLMLEEDWKREPAIGLQPVPRPVIVIGTPRSGTTLLHSLLAADPAGRAPRAWEVLHPSPPPSLAAAGDPRRARTTQALKELCLRMPGLLIAHPYWDEWDDALMECEALPSLDLQNAYLTFFMRTHASLDLGGGTLPGLGDLEGRYAFHKAMLQQLQWGGPERHWVLKGNRHAAALEQLWATYPDAHVIWIHRHPARTFASLMELMVVIREGRVGRALDRATVGLPFLESYAEQLAIGMGSALVDRPYHVRYRELMADPVGAIGTAYEHFGRPLTAEHERRMRTLLADPASSPNRRGTFHYDLAWFGLTREQLDDRLGAYIERFELSDLD